MKMVFSVISSVKFHFALDPWFPSDDIDFIVLHPTSINRYSCDCSRGLDRAKILQCSAPTIQEYIPQWVVCSIWSKSHFSSVIRNDAVYIFRFIMDCYYYYPGSPRWYSRHVRGFRFTHSSLKLVVFWYLYWRSASLQYNSAVGASIIDVAACSSRACIVPTFMDSAHVRCFFQDGCIFNLDLK